MEQPRIGVVGLGVMGLGIAQTFAQAGASVIATDGYAPARENAAERLHAALAPRVAKGAMTDADRDAILARFEVADSVEGLRDCDLVVEAIAEDLAAKQSLFAELEALIPPHAVLATNTSSLSVAAVANGLRHPERVVGLHFFNPAPVMKLVELIGHDGSSTAALDRARDLAESARKTVVACADRPGFIVNRVARPFYGEALALLEEGRDPAEIDAAMVAAGYKLGPFALIDLVGADINLAATESLLAAMDYSPRYFVFPALREQVARGDLGRKTGKGFVTPPNPVNPPDDADAIVLRIESALANEAGWLLAEGGTDQNGIDTALKLGLNFPRGPFESAKQHGFQKVRETLVGLEANTSAELRGRYALSPIFAEA